VDGDVGGRIKGLVILLDHRLKLQDQDLIDDLVDHNESVVALEWLVDALVASDVKITAHESLQLMTLADELGSDRAIRGLAFIAAR